jgi:hypothetical protein
MKKFISISVVALLLFAVLATAVFANPTAPGNARINPEQGEWIIVWDGVAEELQRRAPFADAAAQAAWVSAHADNEVVLNFTNQFWNPNGYNPSQNSDLAGQGNVWAWIYYNDLPFQPGPDTIYVVQGFSVEYRWGTLEYIFNIECSDTGDTDWGNAVSQRWNPDRLIWEWVDANGNPATTEPTIVGEWTPGTNNATPGGVYVPYVQDQNRSVLVELQGNNDIANVDLSLPNTLEGTVNVIHAALQNNEFQVSNRSSQPVTRTLSYLNLTQAFNAAATALSGNVAPAPNTATTLAAVIGEARPVDGTTPASTARVATTINHIQTPDNTAFNILTDGVIGRIVVTIANPA